MKTLDRVEPAGLARYKRKSVCAEEIDRLQPKQCSDSNGSIGNALRKQKPVVVEDAYEPDTHSEELPVEQLPVLRAGLDLQTVQFDKTGQPGWTLYDSVKGKYYRLGWLEFELLSRWQCGVPSVLLEQTNAQTTMRVNKGHLDALLTMLKNNELVEPASDEDWEKLANNANRPDRAIWKSAFSFTMFYRRPLVNPDGFLTAFDRLLTPVYSHKRLLLTVWSILAVLALNGIATHWFEFKNTFSQFMTVDGFLLFALVLVAINALHEIGHGLAAKHFNCRVTEMGIALIFMLPVCYCDTSDTWRLGDHKKRLIVSAGGLIIELLIATIACLFWLVLPDGVLRTCAFFLAVTSLGTTLFINLNPFMKFDGYYLLADALRVDNLQKKSFANFRWQLRQWFTGCAGEKPYRTPESSDKVMSSYAVCTWIYRLILYLGICWFVYQFWFKALGLVLMAGVFVTMMVMPVAKEIVQYFSLVKKNGLSSRFITTVAIIFSLIAILFVPLPRKVSTPAVLSSHSAAKLFAPTSALVGEVLFQHGDVVRAGQKLLVMQSPELLYEQESLQLRLDTLKRRKLLETNQPNNDAGNRISVFDINALQASLQEVDQKINDLTLVAPVNGTVTELPSWLRPGVWVKPNTVLAELVSKSDVEVRAYIPAAKHSLVSNDTAMFYSNADSNRLELGTEHIGEANIEHLDDKALALVNGGEIAVSASDNNELETLQGWHLAILTPTDKEFSINKERTGYVMFPATAKSLAKSAFDRLYGVVIRESGF